MRFQRLKHLPGKIAQAVVHSMNTTGISKVSGAVMKPHDPKQLTRELLCFVLYFQRDRLRHGREDRAAVTGKVSAGRQGGRSSHVHPTPHPTQETHTGSESRL